LRRHASEIRPEPVEQELNLISLFEVGSAGRIRHLKAFDIVSGRAIGEIDEQGCLTIRLEVPSEVRLFFATDMVFAESRSGYLVPPSRLVTQLISAGAIARPGPPRGGVRGHPERHSRFLGREPTQSKGIPARRKGFMDRG
jgi:hypothetical protein